MNRNILLQHLAQAEWHAARGQQHLAKQECLIAELDRDGHDTTEALKLLVTLRKTQALHQRDVERILQELGRRNIGSVHSEESG
jgi:hypothetical protein